MSTITTEQSIPIELNGDTPVLGDTSSAQLISELSTSPEQSGIGALGINGTTLVFQILNFIILYLLLSKFLFKPVVKILGQRREIIEGSLIKAHEIDSEKESWEKKHRDLLDRATKESQEIIALSKKTALENKQKIAQETKIEQEAIIASTIATIEAAKEESLQQAKRELTDLVVQTVKKVSHGVINDADHVKIIETTLKEKK